MQYLSIPVKNKPQLNPVVTRKSFSKWNFKKERSNRQVIHCSSYEIEVKKQGVPRPKTCLDHESSFHPCRRLPEALMVK